MILLPTVKGQILRKWLMYGLVMFVAGMGSYFSLDTMVELAVKSQMTLDPNGQLYPYWIKLPVSITHKFYLFHIENVEEILRGYKPRVSEKGPYAFKEWRRKEIINWADDRSTVKYYEYKKLIFDEANTKGSLNDRITVINPVIATFGATITKLTREQLPMPLVLSPIVYGIVNMFITVHRENLFTTQTVGELILGKRVEMLDTITTLMKPLDWFGITLKQFNKAAMPANNVVGFIAGKNDTPDGPFEVYTGLGNSGPLMHFVSWKDQKKLNWWKTERCNMINGSDGSFFKPRLKPEDILYLFAPDLCRSAPLIFQSQSEYMDIPTFRYVDDPIVLTGTMKVPENDCYCLHKKKNICKIDGLYDLSRCQFGTPLLLTSPHFLNYPHLQQNIDGLKPNLSNHMGYMEIQPTLGTTLFAIKRLMLVVRVENNPYINVYKNVRNNFIPFLWIEVSGGINKKLANKLLYEFVYPIRGANIATASVAIAGLAIISAVFVRIGCERLNHLKTDKICK